MTLTLRHTELALPTPRCSVTALRLGPPLPQGFADPQQLDWRGSGPSQSRGERGQVAPRGGSPWAPPSAGASRMSPPDLR